MTTSKNLESKKSQDRQTNAVAKSSKAPPVNKRPEDMLDAEEISALFRQSEPGMITVLGKFEVTPMIYASVAQQLDSIFWTLVSDEEYSPAELIGDKDWSCFGPDGRRAMELCIKHFAAHPEATLIDLKNGMFALA